MGSVSLLRSARLNDTGSRDSWPHGSPWPCIRRRS